MKWGTVTAAEATERLERATARAGSGTRSYRLKGVAPRELVVRWGGKLGLELGGATDASAGAPAELRLGVDGAWYPRLGAGGALSASSCSSTSALGRAAARPEPAAGAGGGA